MKRIAFITTFVLFVFSIAAQNTQKLSAHLSRLVQKQSTVKGKQTDAHSRSILTLMTTNGGTSAKALEREYSGLNVVDSVGRIYIVSIPISNITTLSADNRVERIEAERMPRPAMDVTPGQINATNVYTGTGLPQAFTGRGIAAGVFDCGFDFTHPAFLNSDGNTRAHYYYDFLWPNSDGTLGHALETPDEIAQYGHSQNVNSNIHGTHVMGIMAGRAVEGKYQGVAPDADLYVADFNSQRSDFENPDEMTSAVAVLGFKRIFDRAEADGKPCVINFSSCESLTLTRQRLLEAEALQQLIGPGRIIVSAAGNDGFRQCYMEKSAADRYAGTGIVNGVGSGEIIDIDLVTPTNQEVRFDFLGMKLTGGGIEGTIIFKTESLDGLQGDTCRLTTNVSMGEIQLRAWRTDYIDERGTVYHISGTMPHLAYLVLCGAAVLLTGDGPAWMYSDVFYSPFTNIGGVAAYSHALPGYNVSWPSTLSGIIAVGATGYKNTVKNLNGEEYTDMQQFAPDETGHATTFSSRGPTFSGLTKPDVVAPGMNINAPYNSFVEVTDALRKEMTDRVDYNGNTYYYTAQSGTSMAAPVVAGVVALWLQAKPDLTPDDVLQVIAATSTQPDASLDYPNNTYGYGQIDAYRGLLHVLSLPSSIPSLSQHQPQKVSFKLHDKQLSVVFNENASQNAELRIYSLQGRLITCRKENTENGQIAIDLTSLPSGVYAVQLNTESKATTGSTLIRL